MKNLNINREEYIDAIRKIKSGNKYKKIIRRTPVSDLQAYYDNSSLYVNLQGNPMIIIIKVKSNIALSEIRFNGWLTTQKRDKIIMVNLTDSKLWNLSIENPFIRYTGNGYDIFKTIEVVNFNKTKTKIKIENRSDNIKIPKNNTILSSSKDYFDGRRPGTIEVSDNKNMSNEVLSSRAKQPTKQISPNEIQGSINYEMSPRIDGLFSSKRNPLLKDKNGEDYIGYFHYYPKTNTYFSNKNPSNKEKNRIQLFTKDNKGVNTNGQY
tara:strand:+ start:27022 stop:27819 length:798 start_codon:yes stop_codon:yes gene_type:complete